MKKLAVLLALAMLCPLRIPSQEDELAANPEMQRQEIVNLERETARAILLANGTFFRRVYGEDFVGTLSRGELVNKAQFIEIVQASHLKYQSFNTSDIRVRIYQNTAIATCLWTARASTGERAMDFAIRAMHIYVNGPRGWQVVAAELTPLPPYAPQPL